MSRLRLGIVAGLVALVSGLAPAPEPAERPLPRTHAHNDYDHPHPLFDALHHGFVPGALNHHQADPCSPEAALRYVAPEGEALDARVAMTDAFGFGGINASLVLRRWDG